jgi:predicted  nucleic acid-binding Zn-ribbon protein
MKSSDTSKRDELDQLRGRVTTAQKGLDAMQVMLRQVDEHNERMQSEIAVTKRIAYAAEEDIKV